MLNDSVYPYSWLDRKRPNRLHQSSGGSSAHCSTVRRNFYIYAPKMCWNSGNLWETNGLTLASQRRAAAPSYRSLHIDRHIAALGHTTTKAPTLIWGSILSRDSLPGLLNFPYLQLLRKLVGSAQLMRIGFGFEHRCEKFNLMTRRRWYAANAELLRIYAQT